MCLIWLAILLAGWAWERDATALAGFFAVSTVAALTAIYKMGNMARLRL